MRGCIGADSVGSGNKFYEFHFVAMGHQWPVDRTIRILKNGRCMAVTILTELYGDTFSIRKKRPQYSADVVAEPRGALHYVNPTL